MCSADKLALHPLKQSHFPSSLLHDPHTPVCVAPLDAEVLVLAKEESLRAHGGRLLGRRPRVDLGDSSREREDREDRLDERRELQLELEVGGEDGTSSLGGERGDAVRMGFGKELTRADAKVVDSTRRSLALVGVLDGVKIYPTGQLGWDGQRDDTPMAPS